CVSASSPGLPSTHAFMLSGIGKSLLIFTWAGAYIAGSLRTHVPPRRNTLSVGSLAYVPFGTPCPHPGQAHAGSSFAHVLVGEPASTLGSSPRACFAGTCATAPWRSRAPVRRARARARGSRPEPRRASDRDARRSPAWSAPRR